MQGSAPCVTVVGAGLAGCEAAWQAARRGARVVLYEMKPAHYSPAHRIPEFAELVCSNSLRSNAIASAVGLLEGGDAASRLVGSCGCRRDRGACGAGPGRGSDRLLAADHRDDPVASADRCPARAGGEDSRGRSGRRRHRSTHGSGAGCRAPAAGGRGLPLLLRCDLPDRLRRLHRSAGVLSRLSLRGGRGGLPESATRRIRLPALRRCTARGEDRAPARVRVAAVLRRLSARRRDRAQGARNPRPRAHEARGPGRSAHRAPSARGGPAASRGQARRPLQSGGLPDQAPHRRAAEGLPQSSRDGECRIRALRVRPPQHLRECAELSGRDPRAQRKAGALSRGPDDGGRGVRRVRGHGLRRRGQRRLRRSRCGASTSPRVHRSRRPAALPGRCGSPEFPADEPQLRALSAADRSLPAHPQAREEPPDRLSGARSHRSPTRSEWRFQVQ